MIPGLFPGQWGGESRQQSHQSPQHQPSHLNAFQMQQQMMMRHQQQHGGQSQITMPAARAQFVSHHGHSTLDNSATAQAQAAMIMNHQSMSNPLAQVSVSGGGGVATSVGGGVSLNGIPNAASFVRMQQQFQQQAGGGGLTQQGSQHQLGQMNPVMCGNAAGGAGASGGGCFNAQSHHHHHQQQQQQAHVALYWNSLQASSIGSQHHGQQEAGQAQQHGMEAAPRTKSAVSGINSHHQQQVGLPAQQQQQQTNQGLVHNQQQPQLLGSGGDAAAQLQDPQTQLLLQQQNLIAQLQRQLQQQQQRGQQQPQPGNNAGSMSQNQLLPGQQQQWQGMPVTGGGEQQLMSSSNNAIHQSQQLGNMSFSSSVGGGQSQNSSQTTSNNPDRLQFPSAIQELMQRNGNASFGSQMGHQKKLERSMQAQQQQLRHHAHLMAKIFVKDSNMSGALSSQKSDQFHEVLGNTCQHSTSHQSSGTPSIPDATLMESMISSDNQARTGSTKPSRVSTPVPPTAPSRAPSAAGSVWGDDVSAMQKQNWNQQVLLEAMARRVSVASTGTQLQGNAPNAQAAQAQAQDPQQKQQQLLMTHLLQQQLGREGVNSSASSARNLVPSITTLGVDGGGGVAVLGGGLSGSAAVGASDEAAGQSILLEQRVKQYQVMQHLKQLQHQKQVVIGGVDSVVGGNHQQSQAQQKLAQFQSQQAQQQHYLCHDQGLPNVVVVSGLAQGRNSKQVKNSASTSAPTASGDSTAASLPNELLPFSWNVGNKSSPPRRGSLGSLSQGSLSQGSLSQGSFGIVDPDPIADGFNTALGCAALVGSTAAGGEGSGGKNGQQKFLDGHFAGGWQSNADVPDRRRINFHIIKVIERMRPDANRMSQNRLPLMAKKLEEHLYRSAYTKEEYVDHASLKRRLHLIAKGVGIAKPDGGDDEGEGGDDSSLAAGGGGSGSVMSGQVEGGQSAGVRGDLNDSSNQTLVSCRRSNNQHAVPMEAVSQGHRDSWLLVGDAGLPPGKKDNFQNQHQQQQTMTLADRQHQNHQSNDCQNSISASSVQLPFDFSVASTSQDSNIPRQKKKKLIHLQQQRRLLLLRHASKCTAGPSCRTKFCPQMVTLWKHMKKCRDKSCKVSHCLSSRCVLNHNYICKSEGKTASCATCALGMKRIRQNGEGGDECYSIAGGDGFGVDDLDSLAMSSNGGGLMDPLDFTIGICEDVNIGGDVHDCLAVGMMAQLNSLEPLDAVTMSEPTMTSKESGGGNPSSTSLSPGGPIPQAIGIILPSPQASQWNVPQQQAQQAIIGVMQPQPLAQVLGPLSTDNGCLTDLQMELQKKQLLLQQVQQQKANLFGQSQKLQLQLMSASDLQQAHQLQKQETILQQLNQQFEQQQLILQSEIQRQVFLIQQQKRSNMQTTVAFTGNNVDDSNRSSGLIASAASASAGAAASIKAFKRSVDRNENDESRPSKIAKPSIRESKGSEMSDKSSRNSTESSGSVTSDLSDVRQKASSDEDFDKVGSSLISSMPVKAIEQHLGSLISSVHLTPRYIARKCLPLVKKLINHKHGWVFKDAVDPVELGIPDYFDIVEHPLDLTLVANKLEDGAYKDMASFEHDTKLVFENAILFNGEDSDVGLMAKESLDFLAAELNAMKGLKIEKELQKKRGNACSLCGNHRRVFDPPALFCSGSCGMQKIRRNATYYTDRFKQNHWCERCYNTHLKESEQIQLDDGRETMKSLLVKLKNDSTPEEAWVQCDQCHEWNHQICALFNGTQSSKLSSYTCPKCYINNIDSMVEGLQVKIFKGARELPHCDQSQSIEEGLSKTLLQAYEKVAIEKGCTVAQVEKAEGLNVRVISSLEKKHKVREEMLARYAKKGYPAEFKVTTKCIVLFQKIHCVDVLLFGLYVYEYGDECAAPNRRRVYISYLDSVRYLEPSSYRTITYQSVITEYLRFVKMRGFHTAHIWSCPPSKGDEYIFHCHPNHQLTPNDDVLCAWYVEMLTKAKDEGIVIDIRTLYDEYFKNNAVNPETGCMYDPTSLPYFDGDYIPGEIEKIIKDLNQDESKREENKLKAPSQKGNPTQKKEGKRVGTRSNPGELVNQDRDKVMNRLDIVLSRMKKNFIVAQLLSDDFIQAIEKGEDVSSWVEGDMGMKHKGKNPNLLDDIQGTEKTASKELNFPDKCAPVSYWKIVGDRGDQDPFMEQGCMDTRLQFLNFCQRKNYQFDELRRAKHSTMMLLAHFHNPRAEQDQQIKAHLQLVFHASNCCGPPDCTSSNCQRMKQLFGHIKTCDVTFKRSCKVCTRLFLLLTKHARDCNLEGCPVPYCDRIKERTRLLLKQQQMMDDRRRDAQNDRAMQEAIHE